MAEGNNLEELRKLPDDVLSEVIREAELLLQAQFQANSVSDQRGFTFASLALTAATAGFGGTIALSQEAATNHSLARLLTLFGIGMALAAGASLLTVFPRTYFFPGNEPTNWLPHNWNEREPAKRDLHQARMEQAQVLQHQITTNRATARWKAIVQRIAFAVALTVILGCGIALVAGITPP